MTRLLQAMAGARHGGAEAFFTRLAIALQRSGQDQIVAIRRDPERRAQLREGGVTVSQLAFGGFFDISTRLALSRIVKNWQPEIVLTWMNRATTMMPRGHYPIVARLGGYYDLKYYRRADHLIGNTEAIVRYIVGSGWPAERAHYLPNFVDAEPAPTISRGVLGVPDDAKLLLALGRLHRNKGFDVLLHAMAHIPECHLLIAGEGPERTTLAAEIARLGLGQRVQLLGWRDDAAALMATADVVVLPSRHEPLGNVVIEAWAHRVPIVAAASDGPSALIRSGENGLLVPVEDAPALAASIRAALDEGSSAMVAAGYVDYRRDYTEAAVVAAYQDLFRRVTS